MFTGIGGFELGIEKAYSKIEPKDSTDSKSRTSQHDGCPLCVGYSEIDKHAIKTFESHFPDIKNYGDATKIKPEELPDFDMLCGGFPCQSFSIAGKRMGFEDTRGTLFFDIARIVKIKRPRFLFLENVAGLLSHDNGRTFSTILATLDELGYNAEWEVLNSKHFGVPQNRQRMFIIGHLRGTSQRQVFPLGQDDTTPIDDRTVVRTITAGAHSGGLHSQMTGIISKTIRAGGRGSLDAQHTWDIILSHSPRCGDPKKGGTGALLSDEYSFTLDSSPHYLLGQRIRRLTPVECERLQGFPDKWTVGSDTQRYKQCGNAVTVNVIQAIAEKILAT